MGHKTGKQKIRIRGEGSKQGTSNDLQDIYKDFNTLEQNIKILEEFPDDESLEITECIQFCRKFYNYAKQNPIPPECAWYAIGERRMILYRHVMPLSDQDFNFYMNLLSTEADIKGFQSLLTYVRFLKLTFFKVDDLYSISNENEQRYIKQWINMKPNFRMKWGICIEMATPESSHVWKVSETQ